MATPGVILIHSFEYRGSDEEWSNGFYFQGDAPSTPADWRSLVDALVTIQKGMLLGTVSIVRALCYADRSADSVYTYDLTHYGGAVSGSVDASGGYTTPGDCAFWLRWNTDRVTSGGKPIYLRNYIHGVDTEARPNEDELMFTQKAAAETVALDLLTASGDWPGLADTDGSALPGGYLVSTFVTTRTLKRRGRRPT